MDTAKSINSLLDALKTGKGEVVLAVSQLEPKIKSSDLTKIDGKLASYSTVYKPWQKDRSFNLKLACKAINGYIFKPGNVFSYNKVVGPREKKYGFRDAPIFVNGGVEDGTGGGICQVSSTLYNAALLANLKILRRAPHSRPVVYTPIGRDATVAYPSVDLRILNTTKAPIYILASIGKRTVNITLYGMKTPGLNVELVSSGHKVIKAPVTEAVDGSLKPGKRVVTDKGRPGHRITTYRVVKQNGEIIKKELISNDYYRPEACVVSVAKPLEMKSSEIIPQSVDN
jgi:vancomycin resistance protein YoaR